MRTSLIIPTRNASSHLARLLPALKMQTLQPDEMLVVDSASSDDTVARFREFGARVEVIDARDFNHGGTRRWASEQVSGEALIVMTQDAIPADPETFANLLDELQQDPLNGVAYGRQLPHPGAGVLGAQVVAALGTEAEMRYRPAPAADRAEGQQREDGKEEGEVGKGDAE